MTNLSTWSCLLAFLLMANCSFNKYPQGENLYGRFCANCHMEDGSGLMALYPPLAGSDYFLQHRHRFACIVRHGLVDTIVVNGIEFTTEMEGLPQLTDVEITNIYNYIVSTWYSDIEPVGYDQIKLHLLDCNED